MIRNLLDHPLNLLIVVLIIVVLVGWKRLPDVARSLGRSMRILKSEVEEMNKDGKPTPSAASSDTVKGDTVKDETFDPTADHAERHTADSTAAADAAERHTADSTATADAAERKTHNQPPV